MSDARSLVALIPRLRRYARALVGDRAAADDLVQDTLERAWAKLHLFREGTDLRAWLFTVMHNVHVNRIRAARPTDVLDDEMPELAQRAAQGDALLVRDLDRAIAALIADLKRTGLWEETLLIWGGEFGRTPTSEGVGKPGRDHNWHGYTTWIAGAGVKGGQAIGATDELGFKAVEDRCHVSDLHATILHLMGIDHTRLSHLHQGLNQRLTGVEEHRVLMKALA